MVNEYKKILYDIVHDSLFVCSYMNDDNNKKLEEIYNYFIDNKNDISDLRNILTLRNNDTREAYNKYIKNILVNVNIDTKLNILNKQSDYEDIMNDSIYIDLWNSIDYDTRIEYLNKKKKYSDIDILLINESLKNFNNKLLNELINNDSIKSKIDNNSIVLNYNSNLLNIIDIEDYELCKIFTRDSYTKLLLNKISNFNDFINIYEKNNKIYELISKNSLIFSNKYNEDIYQFILDNNKFIGKFNNKYLDLFSIVEINKMFMKELDSCSYSTLFTKLYKYDSDKLLKDFNKDTLSKLDIHSIDVYIFDKIDDELRNDIFNDYNLFNRFVDTIIIEAISNYFNEDEIVDYLRNDKFINDVSSYAIELLLNKLSFRSSFNMLQRKNILDKISHLNINVDNKDIVFIKGYLDSPSLIIKSDHNMIYNMINLLSKEDTLYYILLPYIIDSLSNSEIINLFLDKDISIDELISSDELINRLNKSDIIDYINSYFKKNLDLGIFNNKKLCKLLFNLNDKDLDSIDFDEVNYLYETIRMKSLLSKQEVVPTLINYRSVLAAYLTLGLDNTLNLISNGNMDITLDDVKKLQNIIIDEKILTFKENNSSVFQNMGKKLIDNLNNYLDIKDINDFIKVIKKNIFIDNLIYLMLDNEYDSYNNIVNKLFSYIKYYSYDEFSNKKDIYDYCNSFIDLYVKNQRDIYNYEFNKIILSNFKPKENILYDKRKEYGSSYLNNICLKIFIRSLTINNKDEFKVYFKDSYDVDKVKDKYIKYINCPDIEFINILEHVLIPYSNNRFDYDNCLNKINISKPHNYEEYINYLDNLQKVTKLNMKLDKISNEYKGEELISILNYICYDSVLNVKVSSKVKRIINELKNLVSSIGNEVYVDKVSHKFIYSKTIDIYNIDEIVEYKKYNEIIEGIISKTLNYINRYMNKEYIQNEYAYDYFKKVNEEEYEFPINNKYYELRKRVFSLKDIEKIFNGYEISDYKRISNSLNDFLLSDNNLVMVCDGYYDGIVDNLGLIISKWDIICKYISDSNLNINDMSLIDIEHLISIINFNDNVLCTSLDRDIITSIYDNGYYEVLNLDTRLKMLISLFENSYKQVKSSIPYLSYKNDNIEIKTIDKYDSDILRTIKDSKYRIGGSGNDLLCYSILNKNGTQIGIYNDDKLISKIIGVRNGNVLFLNSVDGYLSDNYNNILRGFCNELIKITKDDIEPINFVTIVNNDNYSSRNGYIIDSTVCPIIDNPINRSYDDFKEFSNYEYLLNSHNIYNDYSSNIVTLLASNDIVDKNNFLVYDSESKYYRRRNNVIKLSNNIGEEYLNKINCILYLCNKYNNDDINIKLSSMDTIYIGDDFVVFVSNKNKIFKYVLPFDTRAEKEVELITKNIKN